MSTRCVTPRGVSTGSVPSGAMSAAALGEEFSWAGEPTGNCECREERATFHLDT